ncbi:hypothetical protein D3C72_1504960 [compost metagenome]
MQVVVAQHELRHFRRHGGEKLVALRHRQATTINGGGQCDLDVDLDVGGIHARRIVDRVGIATPARERIGDAALLGDAQIGAFADDLRTQLRGVDADGVIRPVAHLGIGFHRRLDVGADATEPQKIGRRLQDGGHDLEGRGDGFVDANGSHGFRRQRHRFFGARNDHRAAGER